MLICWFFCSGYNPPQFAIDAAKDALDRVECNQYSPTKVDAIEPLALHQHWANNT